MHSNKNKTTLHMYTFKGLYLLWYPVLQSLNIWTDCYKIQYFLFFIKLQLYQNFYKIRQPYSDDVNEGKVFSLGCKHHYRYFSNLMRYLPRIRFSPCYIWCTHFWTTNTVISVGRGLFTDNTCGITAKAKTDIQLQIKYRHYI